MVSATKASTVRQCGVCLIQSVRFYVCVSVSVSLLSLCVSPSPCLPQLSSSLSVFWSGQICFALSPRPSLKKEERLKSPSKTTAPPPLQKNNNNNQPSKTTKNTTKQINKKLLSKTTAKQEQRQQQQTCPKPQIIQTNQPDKQTNNTKQTTTQTNKTLAITFITVLKVVYECKLFLMMAFMPITI